MAARTWWFSAANRSIFPGCGGRRFNKWEGRPRRSLLLSLRKAPNTSMSTEELRFKDFCAMDSSTVSSSRGYLFLSERESLSLAHYREMCDYVTYGRSNIRAAWFKASIKLFPNQQ